VGLATAAGRVVVLLELGDRYDVGGALGLTTAALQRGIAIEILREPALPPGELFGVARTDRTCHLIVADQIEVALDRRFVYLDKVPAWRFRLMRTCRLKRLAAR